MTPNDIAATIAPISDAKLDEVIETIPGALLAREDLASRLRSARGAFGLQRSGELEERGANKAAREKLEQAIRASNKLVKLLEDPDVGVVMSAAAHRRYQLGDAEARQGSDVMFFALGILPGLVEKMELARDTPSIGDKRREDAMRGLVVALAKLFEEATGESLRQPTYDPVTGAISGEFVQFLRASTDDISEVRSKSDEALRHYIREAFEGGEIGEKKTGPRLCANTAHVPKTRITEATEVMGRECESERSTD